MRNILTAIVLAGVAVTAVTADASAQTRRRARVLDRTLLAQDTSSLNSLPLTVNRRSWLDPGNSVAKGGANGPSYVTATTAQFAKTQDKIFAPDKFGNDTLQGQPYVPGRTLPVVSFSTAPNGAVLVDNVYHYQPY